MASNLDPAVLAEDLRALAEYMAQQQDVVLIASLRYAAEQLDRTATTWGVTPEQERVLQAADRWVERWLRAPEIPPQMHARELVGAVQAWRAAR